MSGLLDLWNAATAKVKAVEGQLVGGLQSYETAASVLVNKAVSTPALLYSTMAGTVKSGTAVQPGTGLLGLSTDISTFATRSAKLKSWKLTLESAVKSMALKAGATKLVQAVQVWTDGQFSDALSALSDVDQAARAMQGAVSIGQAPSASQGQDYLNNLKPDAEARAASAENYAQRIFDAIQTAWGDFSSQGKPGISDYFKAAATTPIDAAQKVVTGVASIPDTASSAADWAAKAGRGIIDTAQAAGSGTVNALKYTAIGLVAVAGAYALFTGKQALRNPPRRKRRTRRSR